MELERNKTYTRVELAKWFGIRPNTFTQDKQQKLEELKDYCDYELNLTPKGNFKSITVKEVYCATSRAREGEKLMSWLETGDRWEETADKHVSSCSIVTNYYCHSFGIEYDGSHYIYEEVEGISAENGHNEKVTQRKKKPNSDYALWHYLYRKVSTYYNDKPREDYIKYDLSSGEWNPIKAVLSTEDMIKLRNEIGAKYYGKTLYEDAETLVDTLNNSFMTNNEEEEICIKRKELNELKLYAGLTDKEKRSMIAQEQKENGVLKREGVKRRIKNDK